MKYSELLSMLGKQGFFDLASVVQLTGESRQNIRTQLYRWCKSDKLISLRRGMYAFAKPYRENRVNAAELAKMLYTPSYLSLYWALGFYGLIPEKVVTYTSVTPRVSKMFENNFGVFKYYHIKPPGFFGYSCVKIDKREIIMAVPEKALLDLWFLEKGNWTRDRMQEMRFQNFQLIDIKKLNEYALRVNSTKVFIALKNWMNLSRLDARGDVEL